MSVVIDEVEKELSKEYKTRRDSPQCLTVFSKDLSARCEVLTKDLNSFECTIIRNRPTIGKTYYSSSYIINWMKRSL
jgi:hypothetical protein